MENAIVIAKVFAPMFLVFGLSMIIHSNWYKKIMSELPKNVLLWFISASFKFMFWVLILTFYSSWNFSRALIITIMWRLVVIQTWVYILHPKFLNNIMKFYSKKSMFTIAWLLMFILWIIFLYYWYFSI